MRKMSIQKIKKLIIQASEINEYSEYMEWSKKNNYCDFHEGNPLSQDGSNITEKRLGVKPLFFHTLEQIL